MDRMIHLGLLLAVLSWAGCQASCQQNTSNKSHDSIKHKESVVAVVNKVELFSSDLDEAHEQAVTNLKATGRTISDDIDKDIRGSILRRMIDEELIKQTAQKQGIKVDRFERVAELERYKDKFGGPKGFKAYLEKQNLTEEKIMKTLVDKLTREKLFKSLGHIKDPTEQEIQKHYNANKRLYTVPDMVRARHILLVTSKDAPEEKLALVRKKAEQVLKEAKKGASFVDLVGKYSEGPSAKNGGDLGFFQRGRMVKAFEDAAFNAPLKTPIGPVKTDFGYHIIYVEEKSEAKTASLDNVRGRIVEFLNSSKISKHGKDITLRLRKKADIKIHDYSMTQKQFELLSRK